MHWGFWILQRHKGRKGRSERASCWTAHEKRRIPTVQAAPLLGMTSLLQIQAHPAGPPRGRGGKHGLLFIFLPPTETGEAVFHSPRRGAPVRPAQRSPPRPPVVPHWAGRDGPAATRGRDPRGSRCRPVVALPWAGSSLPPPLLSGAKVKPARAPPATASLPAPAPGASPHPGGTAG